MKLMSSAVTNSAAMQRSPSFSRSGESTMMTILPFRMSSIASSTRENGRLRLAHVLLPMRRASAMVAAISCAADRGSGAARRTSPGCRPRGSRELPAARLPSVVTSQVCGISHTSNPSSVSASTVSETPATADRALLDEVAQEVVRGHDLDDAGEAVSARSDAIVPDAVDVALDDVAAERLAGAQRGLEVHAVAAAERAERACARASRAIASNASAPVRDRRPPSGRRRRRPRSRRGGRRAPPPRRRRGRSSHRRRARRRRRRRSPERFR